MGPCKHCKTLLTPCKRANTNDQKKSPGCAVFVLGTLFLQVFLPREYYRYTHDMYLISIFESKHQTSKHSCKMYTCTNFCTVNCKIYLHIRFVSVLYIHIFLFIYYIYTGTAGQLYLSYRCTHLYQEVCYFFCTPYSFFNIQYLSRFYMQYSWD